MAEAVQFLVIILVTGVVLRFAYLLGRDAAETRAFETIATLREQLRHASLDNKRMREHMRRAGRDPQPEVDQWMH